MISSFNAMLLLIFWTDRGRQMWQEQHAQTHLFLGSISQTTAFCKLWDENKNSSFVTTNLNSFVCTSVPCVDFLCMWQLFVPVLSRGVANQCLMVKSTESYLVLYWKGSVLLGNVNVWVSAFYRKRTILLTWWQIHLGNCKEDVTAVLHSNTWMTRAALSSSPVSISLQTKNLKTTAEEDVPPTRCFWIRMH